MDIKFQEIRSHGKSVSFLLLNSKTNQQIGSAEGYLSDRGDLVSVIKINREFQGQGLGFHVFKHVFSQLGSDGQIKRIVGSWHKDEEFSYCEGGMSTNLGIFNESLDEGDTPINSAMKTPTGKWAAALGYVKCTIDSYSKAEVKAYFEK